MVPVSCKGLGQGNGRDNGKGESKAKAKVFRGLVKGERVHRWCGRFGGVGGTQYMRQKDLDPKRRQKGTKCAVQAPVSRKEKNKVRNINGLPGG